VTAPYSVTELARWSGIARVVIYAEIARGCLAAARRPGGGAWGNQVAWSVDAAEAARWAAAYKTARRGRPGQRGGSQRGGWHVDHDAHRALWRAWRSC
jgi:hypothetical protein